MKLFFETAEQAQRFLLAIPVGFALTLLLDLNPSHGWLKPLWDVLCMLLAVLALLWLMAASAEDGLRLYHALALLLGGLLYLGGVRRVAQGCAHRWRKWKKNRETSSLDAGKTREASNTQR